MSCQDHRPTQPIKQSTAVNSPYSQFRHNLFNAVIYADAIKILKSGKNSNITQIHKTHTTIQQLLVRDYQGDLVPEETFIHSHTS